MQFKPYIVPAKGDTGGVGLAGEDGGVAQPDGLFIMMLLVTLGVSSSAEPSAVVLLLLSPADAAPSTNESTTNSGKSDAQ